LAHAFFANSESLGGHVQGAVATVQASNVPSDSRRQAFQEHVHAAVVKEVTAVVDRDGGLTRFSLALALATVGDFLQVIGLLQEDSTLLDREPRAVLLLAYAYASTDRHDLAEESAAGVLRHHQEHAATNGFILGRARLMIAYTRVVRRFGTFTVPAGSASVLEKMLAMVNMLTSAMSLWPQYLRARRICRASHSRTDRYDALDFGADYAEHAIRLSAFVVRLLPAPLQRITRFLLARATDRLSFDVGYMRGVLNGTKYRARSADPAAVARATQSATLVGDAVAQALVEREAARVEREAARRAATDDERVRHWAAALRWARAAGSPSISLKVLWDAKVAGLLDQVIGDRTGVGELVSAMVDQITGESDHEAASHVASAIASSLAQGDVQRPSSPGGVVG